MSEIDILSLRTDHRFLEQFLPLSRGPDQTVKNKALGRVFKTCSRIFHPDKIVDPNSRFEAQEMFQKIHRNCTVFENTLIKVISLSFFVFYFRNTI